MMNMPISRVEEFEVIPTLEPNEEDRLEEQKLEVEKKRILMWIDRRTSNFATLKARINEMEDKKQWYLRWLGTDNVGQALDLKFVEDVLVQKYAYLNQRKVDKGNGVEVDEEAKVATDEKAFNDDATKATRRSLLENYVVEGESSRPTAKTTTIEVVDKEEEELVDYGSSPEMQTDIFDPATELLRNMEVDNVLTILSQHLESSEPPIP